MADHSPSEAILRNLDPQQKAAVLQTEGPVLVIAGAGSGKTRVLTSRIAYILATTDTDPASILALTFTKKAANEMKERIATMVGRKRAARLTMGTFHSVFARILRQYAHLLGYPSTFTIYDTSDSQNLIKRIIKEKNLGDKEYKPKAVQSRISDAKNNLISPQAYVNNPAVMDTDRSKKMPRTGEIYLAYQKALRENGVMDFDDILVNMALLARVSPDAWREIASRFRYIMVDEYQDTNYAQYKIVRALTLFHKNLCVVGDDSQSIYAFRGANIQNIFNFRSDYAPCKVFRIEHNYRSTKVIVEAANSLIEHNEGRIPKECFSTGEGGEKINIIKAFNEMEEAVLVTQSIQARIRTSFAAYSDFAILYRTNSQSRAIEESLRRSNIPNVILSGTSFYDRTEVKDMLSYFRLVVNPSDNEAFRRSVNRPARGIGDTTVAALDEAARSLGVTLLEAASREDLPSVSSIKNAGALKLNSFASMIRSLVSIRDTVDADDLARLISSKSGMVVAYKMEPTMENLSRAANVEELVSSVVDFVAKRHAEYFEQMQSQSDSSSSSTLPSEAVQYPHVGLSDFLEDIALLSSAESKEEENADSDNKVKLMTVHSAKGLEFPYVYIMGMEDGLFPSYLPGGGIQQNDLEEERRLFYVALTRAEKAVELSYCTHRLRNGNPETPSPSRFLREISPRFLVSPLPRDDWSSDFPSRRSPSPSPFSKPWQRPSSSPSGPSSPSPVRPSAPACASTGKKLVPKASLPSSSSSSSSSSASSSSGRILGVYDLSVGMSVEHKSFGRGVVTALDMGKQMVSVKFPVGEKTLMVAFAKLRLPQD